MRQLILLLCVLFLGVGSICAETIGKIVAIVNNDVITQKELENFMLGLPEEIDLEGMTLEEKALERLIENKLILQRAQELKVSVPPGEIKSITDRIMSRFGTEDEFEKALLDSGLSYREFEERHREQLLIKKLVTFEVQSKVSVSPGEIEDFYRQNPERFTGPETWRFSHILIRKKIPGEKDPEAEKLAQSLLKRIRKGEDFGAIAKEYSEGPHKERGGDLGYVPRGMLLKEVEAFLGTLSIGEITPVVETHAAYNLFQMNDRREKSLIPLNAAEQDIHKLIRAEKIKKRYEEWIKELKKDAYIRK